MSIVLETESGEELARIEDPKNLLHLILPRSDDSSFTCLRYVDWYGDTVFNRLQMEVVQMEWDRLETRVQTPEAKVLYDRVRDLAQRAQEEEHLYLKFYGD